MGRKKKPCLRPDCPTKENCHLHCKCDAGSSCSGHLGAAYCHRSRPVATRRQALCGACQKARERKRARQEPTADGDVAAVRSLRRAVDSDVRCSSGRASSDVDIRTARIPIVNSEAAVKPCDGYEQAMDDELHPSVTSSFSSLDEPFFYCQEGTVSTVPAMERSGHSSCDPVETGLPVKSISSYTACTRTTCIVAPIVVMHVPTYLHPSDDSGYIQMAALIILSEGTVEAEAEAEATPEAQTKDEDAAMLQEDVPERCVDGHVQRTIWELIQNTIIV